MGALDSVFFVSVAAYGMGPQGRVLRLAKGWAARGHSTAVAALQGDVTHGEKERAPGLDVHTLTPHGVEVLKSFRLDAALAVRRFVSHHRPRRIFALESLVDYHVKLGLAGRGERVVTLLGIDRWKWERKHFRPWMIRRQARKSCAVIGNSESTLAGWRRVVGERRFASIPHAVVHNPVDPDEFVPLWERPREGFVIGALGRLAEQKGFDLLIRAFAKLPERIEGRVLELRIQGDGPEREALARLACDLGVAGRVHFRRHSTDVAGFFADLHCLAAPSRWAGFENVVLEAALSGVPVLVTPQTGLIELADASALRFCRGEPNDIRRGLEELARLDAPRRLELARDQRASLVRQLSLDVIAAELEARLADLGVP